MHTQFGIKIYLTLQESRGEENKRSVGDDRKEDKWEEGEIKSKHFWKGTTGMRGMIEGRANGRRE